MLRKKLLLTYLISTISILAVVGISALYIIRDTIDEQMQLLIQNSFSEGYKLLSNKVNTINSAILESSIDTQLQEHLQEIQDCILPQCEDPKAIREDTYRISRIFFKEEAINIYPVDRYGTVWEWNEKKEVYQRAQDPQENIWYQHYQTGGASVAFLRSPKSDGGVFAVKNILSTEDWQTVVAVLCVEIRGESMNLLLNKIDLGKNSTVMLATKDEVLFPFYLRGTDCSTIFDTTISTPYVDENDNMIFYEHLDMPDMYLVGSVHKDTVLAKGRSVQTVFIYTAAIAISISVLLALIFSHNISRPIMEIAESMKKFHPNASVKREESKQTGEIKILNDSFNYMTDVIQELIDDVYTAQLKEKQAELVALQAQINPHFLYNTLDSVNWMALKYGAYDIQEMISALATMLRHSLNHGENMISVRNEIEQLKSYIYIQKFRFDNKFEDYFLIDSQILDCTMIKLILQPLVENAIIHGFENLDSGGLLFINGYLNNGTIVFDIMNNGELVDLDKIKKKIQRQDESEKKSYGINNVNDRLIAKYGPKYGLHYMIHEQYTIARIQIPWGDRQS